MYHISSKLYILKSMSFDHLKKLLPCTAKHQLLAYLQQNPADLKELYPLALSEQQPYAWRAAWLLSSYLQKNTPGIADFLEAIVQQLPLKTDGHNRELLHILRRFEWQEAWIAPLFDNCQELWCTTSSLSSLRSHAFSIMFDIVQIYPELKNELTLLCEEHYLIELSPAIKKSIQKKISLLTTCY